MSHEDSKLSVLAYADGFTLWHYRDGGAKNTILNANNNTLGFAHDILRKGDVVFIEAQESTFTATVRNISDDEKVTIIES